MKYAIITGTAGGLGKVFSSSLIKAGWTVFGGDVVPQQKMDRFVPIDLDITSVSSIQSSYNEIKKITENIDLIVDNAGIMDFGSLVETDIKSIEKIFHVNLLGHILLNKTFFPLLNKKNGRIIITTSELGYHQAQPFNSLYSITKIALDSYADALRRELNCMKIKVIKLQFGGFKTSIINSTNNKYNDALNNTIYFNSQIKKLIPFINKGLKNAKPPEKAEKIFLKAVNSKHPKIYYRFNNLVVLKLLDLFGTKGNDVIFKLFFKTTHPF